MALGETTAGVQRRVVGRTLALAAIGIVIGTLGSLVASRWVASLLYGVEPLDPATFLRTVVVLVLVSTAAGFLPAWRASRTDVVAVLQSSG